jgi:hypothetical protein
VARLIALGTVTMRRDWVSAQPSPNVLERESYGCSLQTKWQWVQSSD